MGCVRFFERDGRRKRKVERATLYLTALGVYEAHLNGKRVGNYVLAPGWTAYDKRLQYQEYDITDLVVEENELIVTLGKGWFRSPMPGWQDTPDKLQRMGRPGGILGEVHIVYMDGSEEVIVTDQSWTWGESRVRFSEIYDGEFCDATFVTKEWNTVKEFAWSKEILIPQEGEEIREQEVVAAKSVFRTPAGELVVDFGQEITGYVEFTVDAHAGDRIHILHGEVSGCRRKFLQCKLQKCKSGDKLYLQRGNTDLASGADVLWFPIPFAGRISGRSNAGTVPGNRSIFQHPKNRCNPDFGSGSESADLQYLLGTKRQLPGCADRLPAA